MAVGRRQPLQALRARCFLNSYKSEPKPCELNATSLGVGVCVEEGDRVCVGGGDDITGRAPSIFTPVCGGNPGYLLL